MVRERDIEAHLFRQVRALGGECFKLTPTRAGIPDRLVLLPGQPGMLVELKRPGGIVSPIQAVVHNRLAAMGHPVIVLWTKPQVDAWLQQNQEELE